MPTTSTNLANGESVEAIRTFMSECSFEATRPKEAEIAALGRLLPAGARLFLTALPSRPFNEMERATALTQAAGLTPVPHISARHFQSFAQLDAHIHALSAAGAGELMLVGGDTAKPLGEVVDSLAIIESGALERNGFTRIHLPGFPDGHPHLDADGLETILVNKLAALQQRGIESDIITQFCFDTAPIMKWLAQLRARGVHAPVRIGLAGPTNLFKWLAYARRCGVKASAEALASRSGLVRHAFKAVAPDPLIRALAQAQREKRFENVAPHLFAFGGIVETAQWAQAPMSGAIAPNSEGGFDAL